MVPARGPRTLGCVRRLERDVKNPQPSQLGTLHAGAVQATVTIAPPERSGHLFCRLDLMSAAARHGGASASGTETKNKVPPETFRF